MRAIQAINEAFTDMALEGASAADIVGRAASMARAPMLLENRRHQILAIATAGVASGGLLASWSDVCREPIGPGCALAIGSVEPWLVASVGARGNVWGRLAMFPLEKPATEREFRVLQGAATAVTLNHLANPDRESPELQSQGSVLTDIISGAEPVAEIEARVRAWGLGLRDHVLTGCVIRLRSGERSAVRVRNVGGCLTIQNTVTAAKHSQVPALAGRLGPNTIGVLISFPPGTDRNALLMHFAEAVHSYCWDPGADSPILGVGSPVLSVRDLRRSFREAEQVVDSVGDRPLKFVYQLSDVRIRGLIHMLRDDDRVAAFCQRELGMLLEVDQGNRAKLLPVLEAYLDAGCNKSAAASALRLSRPALYAKLERIQDILGVDLNSVESCLSLHVALIGAKALYPSEAKCVAD